MGQRFEAAFSCAAVRARGCWTAIGRAPLQRFAQRRVGWPSPGSMLVSAFPSYLLSTAGDVVEAAEDVPFSQLLAF